MRIRGGDQLVEHRVGKDLPPLADVRLQGALAGVLDRRGVPVIDPWLARRLKVRPQPYATAEGKHATEQ